MENGCAARYPILLVHGAGFRDLKWPVYWGRIPAALEREGAAVCYGEQDCWGSIGTNAEALSLRIEAVCRERGCEKVHIIAHSKGGLDARRAAALCGGRIASITTVATPHRGSKTLDRLLTLPRSLWGTAAFAVDNWIRLVGDRKPDFLRLCEDMTTESMRRFNEQNPDLPGIRYASYACVMRHPFSDINLSTANFVLNRLEGPNDGLVSAESALWGGERHVLRGAGLRGVSHLDAIDLRRAPLTKRAGEGIMDICDVYVGIVRKLKEEGL